MTYLEVTPCDNPHLRDMVLDLPSSLKKAREDGDLMPVFEWMVQKKGRPLDQVLGEVSRLTGIPATVDIGDQSAYTAAQLMSVLYAYTKAPKLVCHDFRMVLTHGGGTFLGEFSSGRQVIAFSPREYARAAGLDKMDIEALILEKGIRPLAKEVYAYLPMRKALEGLRKGSQS